MDYIKFSNGKEYRVSSDGRYLETRFENNGQKDWRQENYANGKRIKDLREAMGANVECKLDDGRWYEPCMGGGVKLTWDEQMNDLNAKKKAKAEERKKENGNAKLSKKEQKEEMRKMQEEEWQARMEEQRRREEEEEEAERQLYGKLFGFDFDEKPYREQIETVLTKHLTGEPTEEQSVHMLNLSVRFSAFEVNISDWFSKFQENTINGNANVKSFVDDFINTFPDFWNKYPNLENTEKVFQSFSDDVDTQKCGIFDISGKMKNKRISDLKEKRESIVSELNDNFCSLRHELIMSEDYLRIYIIRRKEYDKMQKSGKGHETNFFGFEKSDSPLSRARASLSWYASSFVSHFGGAIYLYQDILEEHKDLTKVTKSLYEASELKKYAETPLIANVGEDGVEIVTKLNKMSDFNKDIFDKIGDSYIEFCEKVLFIKEDKNIGLINKIGLDKLTDMFGIK